MEKFLQLEVWKKTHQLILKIYVRTSQFPDSEKYGLTSQMRRSAVSIAANIAEGTKRKTAADRKHFHVMADASLEELKYYFILAADLGYMNKPDAEGLLADAREIGRMLNGLTKSIEKTLIA